ncbi:MAG TPA: phosphatase PAP2/dual specificity phosphatase family protein [Pirellulales bacterium]|nr:phosphatase PAP2/dual specificity phosphatase family protein [Pirellulales bacterium]
MGNFHRVARAPRRSLKAAAVAAAGLSVLFICVYGGANWLTSQRSDVGTWYYAWERWIPFVPLMVIPYMSIDLFYIAAPFLCADQLELRTYCRRIALAICVAGALFLLVPLKLGVVRPPLTGWMGDAFGWFFAADLPYNLFPSLHIALRTILADVYSRHTRGLWRGAVNVWFSLVGISTLLTYQHHLVDVAGGFVLALFCFYLIPPIPQPAGVMRNRRIGLYYLATTVIASAGAIAFWPAGGFLLWLAVACLIAAAGYFGCGAAIYRKQDGRLPLSTRLVLAPLLIGQYLSLCHYRRQCRAWDEVAPGVWIGRKLSEVEAAGAVRGGVIAVLDLTAEFSEAEAFLATNYLNIAILDLTAPTAQQIQMGIAFIQANASRGVVYVHCKIGYSRSAAVVGSYLLDIGLTSSAEDAIARLRAARGSIVIRPEATAAIAWFAHSVAARPLSH